MQERQRGVRASNVRSMRARTGRRPGIASAAALFCRQTGSFKVAVRRLPPSPPFSSFLRGVWYSYIARACVGRAAFIAGWGSPPRSFARTPPLGDRGSARTPTSLEIATAEALSAQG